MLTIFFGTDVVGVRTKAHAYIDARTADGCTVETITREGFAPGLFASLGGGTSLFGGNSVYAIDTPSEDEAMLTEFLGTAGLLAASPHIFVVIENALTTEAVEELKRTAELVEVKAGKKESFNPFALADALLRKDKKTLWILLTSAWRNGFSSEEIIGTLFWQLKVLRLVARTKSPEEAGLKPFVYQKAKRALTTFKAGETDTLSEKLLTLYHDGHAGKRDINLALERWVLSL